MATVFASDRTAPVIATARGILNAILRPGVTLAVWQRIIPEHIASWLEALDFDTIDDVECVCEVTGARAALRERLCDAGFLNSPETRWLADDAAALAQNYAAIMDLSEVAIRLEVIETDACRKFHADYVTVRAITTYQGPGTQWLSMADAASLGCGVSLDELTIEAIATGSVALMKGRSWAPDNPLVHRSPPILANKGRRLTLVLDPPRAVEE